MAHQPIRSKSRIAFKKGDYVGIKCEIADGPFSTEKLVTFDTVDGEISGFVRVSELREMADGWQVRAKVLSLSKDTIEVLIVGSFLRINGIANVPRQLAVVA